MTHNLKNIRNVKSKHLQYYTGITIKMFDSNDDYDFAPSKNSKLSSLFDTQMCQGDDANESLSYTAPKQPKAVKKEEIQQTPPKIQSTVVFAKVVSLWKQDDTKYNSTGKHGLAIVEYKEQNLFELILYKERNNILIRRVLNDTLEMIWQNNDFFTFYDDTHQNWLFQFANENDLLEFTSQVQKHKVKLKDTRQKNEPTISSAEENIDKANIKQDILSRITKMGQRIIPSDVSKDTSTDLSDSELEENKVERKVVPRKFKKPEIHASTSMKQLVPSFNNETISNQPMVISQPVGYEPMHLLMHQNMEMKYALSQLTTKLDSVLGDSTIRKENSAESKVKVLELKLENTTRELENLQRIYSQLKTDHQMLQDKTKCFDDNFEIEKEKMTQQLDKANEIIEEYKQEVTALSDKLQINDLKLQQLDGLQEQNNELVVKNNILSAQIDNLNSQLENYVNNPIKNPEECSKAIKQLTKQCMSETYQRILEQLETENNGFSSEKLKKIVGEGIKNGTYQIMQGLPDCFKETGS